MSIKGYVKELEDINIELTRLKKLTRSLNLKKKEIEANIVEYLADKDTPGVKYKNSTILVKSTMKRYPLRKAESQTNTRRVLEDYGIRDPEAFLLELANAKKGESVEESKITIKRQK